MNFTLEFTEVETEDGSLQFLLHLSGAEGEASELIEVRETE